MATKFKVQKAIRQSNNWADDLKTANQVNSIDDFKRPSYQQVNNSSLLDLNSTLFDKHQIERKSSSNEKKVNR